ncbi:conserved hypothetical protein [bacterium A37T11]|nr:conserved hypothetical protein [bacterium A37T11]
MTAISKTTEILNDLIEINNDRIEGYTRAIEDSEAIDVDLKTLFEYYIQQTKGFNRDLSAEVSKLGEAPEEGTRMSGKLHRLWLDVKAKFTGSDRKSILEECERGEDASKEAYTEALADSEGLPEEIVKLISQQADKQREGHDKIKALRDAQV